MIQDKIFFDEKDPTGLSYNTPFTYFGSYQGRLWSKAPGGEIKYYTQNSDLSVYATTGSNQFNGNQAITGSLTVTGGIIGTTATSSYVEYSNVANKPTLVSGSSQVSFSGIVNKPTLVSSSVQVLNYGIFATTGSNGFNGSQSITGSLTVTGQVVAQTLNVQQVTSSIVYSSGSNVFGNSLANTQQFTGSVSVTGSLTVAGALNGTSASFSGIVGVGGATEAGWSLKSNGNLKVENSNGTTVLQVNDTSTGGKTWSLISAGAGNAHSIPAGTFYLRNSSDSITAFQIASTGAATFSSNVTATGNLNLQGAVTRNINFYDSSNTNINAQIQYDQISSNSGQLFFGTNNAGTFATRLTISNTGAATFSSSVTIEGSFTQIRSGNELRFWRSDNAIYTKMFDAGSTAANGFTFDNLNAEGFHFKNNGTTIMRMNSTGNVGIGTTSPLGKLDVYRAAGGSGTAAIVISNGEGGGGRNWGLSTEVVTAGDFAILQSTTNGGTPSPTSTNVKFYINPSGNIGIGTASPSTNLHVEGPTISYGQVRILSTSNSGGEASIHFGRTDQTLEQRWTVGQGVASIGNSFGFYTGGSPRMVLTTGGTLLLGTTSGTGIATGSSVNQGVDISGGVISIQTNNNSNNYWSKATGYTSPDFTAHFVNGNYVGGISTNGSSTNYATASDYRLKQDLKDFDGITLINKIKTYDYEWKVDNTRMFGVIAHELQEVLPYAVTGEKDAERMQGVDYSKLIPILVKSIQELSTKVETLEAEIQTLKQ